MSGIATAIVGSTIVGGLISSDASGDAAAAQQQSNAAAIAEERRQFDAIRKLLEPYVNVGTPALAQQRALVGLDGAAAQRAAISAIENSPMFQASVRQGENAILQNASATGGLRGGNIQAALSQFRPQMLQAEIERQYSRLGGLTSLGQQSAAGVGTAGSAMGTNVANLLTQSGASQAGAILAGGQAAANVVGSIPGMLTTYQSLTGQSPFGGVAAPNIAQQYGTLPGSQQTAMLANQMIGF